MQLEKNKEGRKAGGEVKQIGWKKRNKGGDRKGEREKRKNRRREHRKEGRVEKEIGMKGRKDEETEE